MKIDLYTIAWNESRMLPHFLDYHLPWVDRMIVYDDDSDDGTREALAAHPQVEVRPFPPKGNSFALAALALWQDAWKESRGRADWVVLANVDEYIWHADGMRAYLERCRDAGATMIHPRGYEMIADAFPPPGTPLPLALRRGVPMFGNDKRQVFDPNAIEDMGYSPGRHWARPAGRAIDAHPVEARLLHYKYVDYHGYHVPRQKALGARLLPGDRELGLGAQYAWPEEHRRGAYEWLALHATDVFAG